MADDLAQLMQVVNQRGVTEAQLAAVLVSPATVGLGYNPLPRGRLTAGVAANRT